MNLLRSSVILVTLCCASTAFALEVQFTDSDGDDRMWLCQAPKSGEDIRGTVTVSHSGYYRLSTIDNTMFDSGDHQRNESYYLLIKNSLNPSGMPIDPNCAGVYVLLDGVSLPAHLGTFLLAEGEVNTIELHHYCELYREGLCTQWFDPEGESGGGCRNCESVSLVLSSIDLDRELNICQPGFQSVMDEDICDGLDNDCDGQVDEDCPNACVPSTEVCDGVDNDCDGLVDEERVCSSCMPTQELCDGEDNDCDGEVDEGEVCVVSCVPSLEVCDGVDNDCDGEIDLGAHCELGAVCAFGACRQECRSMCDDENESCVDGVCLPQPCGDEYCAPGVLCIGERCHDLCEGVACTPGAVCKNGQCVDASCHSSACPSGLVCIQGQCVSDPCREMVCDEPNEFCREGACVSSCAVLSCAEGSFCDDGVCVSDPCHGVSCAADTVCVQGQCVLDPCQDVHCPGQLLCIQGACVGDPCDGMSCPASQHCHLGQCYTAPQLEALGLLGMQEIDGACACQLASSRSSFPLAALLLFGLLLPLRWRRR